MQAYNERNYAQCVLQSRSRSLVVSKLRSDRLTIAPLQPVLLLVFWHGARDNPGESPMGTVCLHLRMSILQSEPLVVRWEAKRVLSGGRRRGHPEEPALVLVQGPQLPGRSLVLDFHRV